MYTKILKNRIFLTITISIVISAFIFSPLGLLNGIYHYINENIKATLIKHEENSNNNIVSVVEIDDEAYEKLGFPFSRREYIPIIENLNKAGAIVIGFDIIFADNNPDTEGDNEFAEAIENAGNIVLGGAALPDTYNENKKVIEKPIPKFLSGALAFGYYEPRIDSSLALSFYPSQKLYDKAGNLGTYLHFSVALVRSYYSIIRNDPSVLSYTRENNNFFFLTSENKIPYSTEDDKYILINYLPVNGANEPFHKDSFLNVYNNNFNPKDFEGKIVIIGATAKGLKDTFNTPNGLQYGVYVHANIVNTILTKNFLLLFPKNLEILFIFLLIALSVYFNLSRSSYVVVFSNISIAIIFLVIFPWVIFASTNLLLNYFFQLYLAFILSLALSNVVKYLLENKDKNKLNKALTEYVSKAIADEILSSGGQVKLDGEEKRITIYFSDIEGFTSISEKMGAEELVLFLREYLTEMSNIILDEKGFLNKYEGDAIMALWGVFLDDEISSHYAVSVALKQQEALKELNKNWKKRGIGEIKTRIGLHIGNAIVGNIGATGRKIEYTALGDSVNLASRLEGVNKFYGTYTCVSEDIYKETKTRFEFRYLDTIRVKGKDKAVKIYEVLSHKGELDKAKKALISKFLEARALYEEKNFKEALVLFKELADLGDKPSGVYLKRCEDFLEKKPSRTWDSIWDFEEK